MAYAALQDMIDRFGSAELTDLTDRTGTGTPDATVAGTALGDASSVVDSYLAGRFVLPLATVPPVVLRWTCDIARFLLWRDAAGDAVKALFNAAIAALKAVQAGQMTLEAAAVETPTEDTVLVDAAPRRFGRGSGLCRF